MALRTNVFTKDFDSFRESMADLSHYLLLVDWRFGEANQSVEQSLAILEKQGHKNKFFAGSALSVVNVFHSGTAPMRAPCGKRITEGETIVPMTKEMEGRFHSYLLVAGFERLEALLKDLYGRMLYQLRRRITLPSKRDFHKNKPKEAKNVGNAPYYREYARYACRRNCDEAMAAFRKALPWETIIFHLMHGMTFEEIHGLLGFCRHCIVHGEGRLPDEVRVSLTINQITFIRSCMRKSILTREETILPDARKTDLVIEMLVSYAYGLYVLLSEKCDMEIEQPYFRR